jgi:hypothetical protein
MTDKPEMKTFLMELKGGKLRRVTVPATWKVTFGPLVPSEVRHGDVRTFALRFYETKEQQRAVFTDVVSFRDMSLEVEERVSKVKQKMVHKEAPGGRREMMVEARITEWRNPDAPDDDGGVAAQDQEFLAIADDAAKPNDF